MNDNNVNVSMGSIRGGAGQPDNMNPDVNMMPDNMGGLPGTYETPSKESAYRGFLGFVFCEYIFHLIWPIIYGLYFFRVLGK